MRGKDFWLTEQNYLARVTPLLGMEYSYKKPSGRMFDGTARQATSSTLWVEFDVATGVLEKVNEPGFYTKIAFQNMPCGLRWPQKSRCRVGFETQSNK